MKSASLEVFMGDFESCFIQTEDGDVTFGSKSGSIKMDNWNGQLDRSSLLWNFVWRLKLLIRKIVEFYPRFFLDFALIHQIKK